MVCSGCTAGTCDSPARSTVRSGAAVRSSGLTECSTAVGMTLVPPFLAHPSWPMAEHSPGVRQEKDDRSLLCSPRVGGKSSAFQAGRARHLQKQRNDQEHYANGQKNGPAFSGG